LDYDARTAAMGIDMAARMRMGGVAFGKPRGRRLYTVAALVAVAVIGLGFARSFYLKAWFATPPLSGLLWAHGLAMTAWLLLFLVQVRLAATRRIAVHRRLGALGAVLLPVIVVLGVMAAQAAARRGFTPAPQVTPLMFMAIPLVDVALFAALVGLALWNRRRPDVHKRLMLLGTLSILTPGIARIPFAPLQHAGLPAFFGLMLLVVVACIAIDTWRHRRLHPAFGWGGAAVLLSVPARIAMSGTAWWAAFAGWLIAG
jgi:hypothetical protein